jgi:serine/threonine protein kinase
MDTMIGRTIDKYRIVQQIEEGGTSTVYKAYQSGLDRYVALKILSPYHTEKPDFSRRFRREARAIARLHHPNILPIYDFGEADGFRFIAMRYIEGSHTLKQEMERPLNLLRAIDLISQVAAALDHAHQHGVIHRDIKPSNILIEGRWALLSDFGLAKTAVDSGKMTRSGLSVGTPAYMSPEQGQGLLMDHRTDIYSLGVIVFELLTGQIPHNAETPFAIVLKRATEPLTMPRSKYPEVTEAVKQAVLKALAPNPDDRFQSAGAFAYALRKALAGAGAVDVHELAKATTPELPAEVEEGAPPDHGIARGLPFVRWPRRLLPAALIILVLVMAIGLRLALLPLFDQWMAPISSTELPSTVVATATRPLMEQPPTPAANVASAALVSAADGILYKAQDGEGER